MVWEEVRSKKGRWGRGGAETQVSGQDYMGKDCRKEDACVEGREKGARAAQKLHTSLPDPPSEGEEVRWEHPRLPSRQPKSISVSSRQSQPAEEPRIHGPCIPASGTSPEGSVASAPPATKPDFKAPHGAFSQLCSLEQEVCE